MSETNTGIPGINRELVDQVYDEVRTDFLVLQRDEMGFAREHDLASFIVYGKLVGKTNEELGKELDPAATAPPVMPSERAGRAIGFLAGHRLLRTAFGGPFAELQSSDALVAYYKSVLTNPGRLEADFRRDWGQQDAAGYLVDEKLTKTDSRFGSKLLLVIHGRLANPAQPRFRTPSPREAAEHQSPSLGISLPNQDTRNPHEIRARQATARRMSAITGGTRFN